MPTDRKHPSTTRNAPGVIPVAITARVLACTVLAGAVAACTSGPQAGSYSTSYSASPAYPASPASTVYVQGPDGQQTSTVSPQSQKAAADAASILAQFAPPPGSKRLTAAPSLDDGALRAPGWPGGSPYLVDEASWWVVPGQAQNVAGYEGAHLPGQFKPSGTGAGSSGVSSVYTFDLPPVPGVLPVRRMMLTMVSTDNKHTAVRVDAQVAWQPPR